MFKFGFSQEDEVDEKGQASKKDVLEWIAAFKVDVSKQLIENDYDSDDYTETEIVPDCKLKLVKSEKVLEDLTIENSEAIIEAESQHSDLIPAKYEGGLKIWECTYDLGKYIYDRDIDLQKKVILDLGCGAGVIGLIGLLKGATVHFQDYNVEVINSVTIPNVILNSDDGKEGLKKCEFYSGDWESFTTLSNGGDNDSLTMYDLIFTSETIYNPDNHRKLYDVFKQRLKEDGVGFIAGKTYYFGVGGGMRQFQKLVEDDGFFDIEVAWSSTGGLQREILKISKKDK